MPPKAHATSRKHKQSTSSPVRRSPRLAGATTASSVACDSDKDPSEDESSHSSGGKQESKDINDDPSARLLEQHNSIKTREDEPSIENQAEQVANTTKDVARDKVAVQDKATGQNKPTNQDEPTNVKPSGTEQNPIYSWLEAGTWPRQFLDNPNQFPIMGRSRSKKNNGRSIHMTSTPGTSRVNAPYNNPRYETGLKKRGIYLASPPGGLTRHSQELCEELSKSRTDTPRDSNFDDDVFQMTIDALHGMGEARVVRDIGLLLVPSAEGLAIRGSINTPVAETVNDALDMSMPVFGPRPQPDYSVGFRFDTFSDVQQAILEDSAAMVTCNSCFPFLVSEAKSGNVSLDAADRQNAHCMAIAVRAVATLFAAVEQEPGINGELLAFSVSHSDREVRIYGHCVEIVDGKVNCYREPLHNFLLTAEKGKDRWRAYNFVRNLYEQWVPGHLDRIRSAIDKLAEDANLGARWTTA